MVKIMKDEALKYLINLIPKCKQIIRTRNNLIPVYSCHTRSFKHSFLPEKLWDNFDIQKQIIIIYLSSKNIIFNIFDPVGVKFLARLWLGFSHLNDHRFQHCFQGCMNPLCSCSLEIEDTLHYLLHCHHFTDICIEIMNSIKSVYDNFESSPDKD